MAALEIYRDTNFGATLTNSLDELVEAGALSVDEKEMVLKRFDCEMAKALKASASGVKFYGEMKWHNGFNDVWEFNTTSLTMVVRDQTLVLKQPVKIVAAKEV